MEVTTQLFIRACRSKDPHKRVRSVYRRYYLGVIDEHTSFYLSGILSSIVDEWCKMTFCEIIDECNPSNASRYEDEIVSYHDLVLKVLISKIRHTRSSKFKGLRIPAIHRVKQVVQNKNKNIIIHATDERIEGWCRTPHWGKCQVIAFSKNLGKWHTATSICMPSCIESSFIIQECFRQSFKELEKVLLAEKK
jgi:hypothetical protein